MGASRLAPGHKRDQLDKLSEVLGAAHEGEFYRQFVSYWKDPAQAVIGAELPPTRFDEPSSLGLFERMMLLDALTYLPDDILVKVDRAAMAASLETRVPMLDHRVFDFAQRLPSSYKRRDGQGKWLLRQVLYRHVPRDMIDRRSEEHTSELQSLMRISYAVFCLKKKNIHYKPQ